MKFFHPVSSYDGLFPTASTRYVSLGGNLISSATYGGGAETIIPAGATIRNLYVGSTSAPGSGNSWTLTLQLLSGGVWTDTSLVTVLSDGNTSANSGSTEVSFSAADIVCIKLQPSSAFTTIPLSISIEVEPDDTATQFMFTTGYGQPVSSTYYGLMGQYYSNSTSDDGRNIFISSGTLSGFHQHWGTFVTSPVNGVISRAWSKNGSATNVSTSLISSLSPTYTTDADTIAISANDIILGTASTVASILSAAPCGSSFIWTPDTAGEVQYLNVNAPSTGITSYCSITSDDVGATVQSIGSFATTNVIIKQITATPRTTIVTGSYDITLQTGPIGSLTDTALTVNLNSGSAATSTGNISLAAGECLRYKIVPNSTPTSSRIMLSLLLENEPTGPTLKNTATIYPVYGAIIGL